MHWLKEKSIYSKWDKKSEKKYSKKGNKIKIVSINISINKKNYWSLSQDKIDLACLKIIDALYFLPCKSFFINPILTIFM